MENMEQIVKLSLLYDFYGELLTEHQKSICEDYFFNDIGLSEIAQERGISRQAVSDMVKRSEKLLTDYEEKLHLVERFLRTKEKVKKIKSLISELRKLDDSHNSNERDMIDNIYSLSDMILEEL